MEQEPHIKIVPIRHRRASDRYQGTASESAPTLLRPSTFTPYVLMTAAHNEEATIEMTIQSVLAQTRLPERWAIVSDSSVDRTDQIVQDYAQTHPWINYARITRAPGRNFSSKIIALREAWPLLQGARFEAIGNIDADVTLPETYFAALLERLDADPALGIAGGWVCERSKGRFIARTFNASGSVPHAAQLVRRDCYESIGGYALLRYGGEDWHALVSAKMRGWRAEAFQDLKIYHHRPTGHLWGSAFRSGRMDYSFGSYPPFEFLKCVRRLLSPPFIDGPGRVCGFCLGYLLAEERQVSPELMKFLREEQKLRLIESIKSLFRGDGGEHPHFA